MARQVRLKPQKHLALNTEGVLQSPQQCILINSVEASTQIKQAKQGDMLLIHINVVYYLEEQSQCCDDALGIGISNIRNR